jgi:undecaprenyl-diphosphatase
VARRSRSRLVARAESLPIGAWRKRPEIWLLGGIFLAGILLLAFGRIAEEVIEGDAAKFDQAVMLALRTPSDASDPLGPAWLEEAARDITSLGSYAVLGFMFGAVVIYLLMTKRRSATLWLSASILGGVLLSNALKFAFARPRPELVAPLARVFTSSFPSGHATLAAVTYLTLGALLASLHRSRRLKLYFIGLAIILTVAIGLSRVYLGVHYPTDVLAGWCIGAAWAALCWSLAAWLQRHGKIEPAKEDAVDEGDRANG